MSKENQTDSSNDYEIMITPRLWKKLLAARKKRRGLWKRRGRNSRRGKREDGDDDDEIMITPRLWKKLQAARKNRGNGGNRFLPPFPDFGQEYYRQKWPWSPLNTHFLNPDCVTIPWLLPLGKISHWIFSVTAFLVIKSRWSPFFVKWSVGLMWPQFCCQQPSI